MPSYFAFATASYSFDTFVYCLMNSTPTLSSLIPSSILTCNNSHVSFFMVKLNSSAFFYCTMSEVIVRTLGCKPLAPLSAANLSALLHSIKFFCKMWVLVQCSSVSAQYPITSKFGGEAQYVIPYWLQEIHRLAYLSSLWQYDGIAMSNIVIVIIGIDI